MNNVVLRRRNYCRQHYYYPRDPHQCKTKTGLHSYRARGRDYETKTYVAVVWNTWGRLIRVRYAKVHFLNYILLINTALLYVV